MRLVAAVLAVVILVALTACKQADPYGGCSQHPGQCGQNR